MFFDNYCPPPSAPSLETKIRVRQGADWTFFFEPANADGTPFDWIGFVPSGRLLIGDAEPIAVPGTLLRDDETDVTSGFELFVARSVTRLVPAEPWDAGAVDLGPGTIPRPPDHRPASAPPGRPFPGLPPMLVGGAPSVRLEIVATDEPTGQQFSVYIVPLNVVAP